MQLQGASAARAVLKAAAVAAGARGADALGAGGAWLEQLAPSSPRQASDGCLCVAPALCLPAAASRPAALLVVARS